MIEALLGKLLASKLGIAGLAALAGALAAKAAPMARPLLGKFIKAKLDYALAPNLADPIEKEKLLKLARAAMEYAEYKIPDRGMGLDKHDLVVRSLSKFIPGVAAEAIGNLVQESFDSLDDEMKKHLNINQA